MIAQLQGRLLEKSPTRVLLDVQGVGYEILVPLSTYEKLGPVGETATLLTYLHVREDALQLFGFATPGERLLFQHLISVNGVGPKLGQSILSGCSVENFCAHIQNNATAALTAIPGVGKKTAERLVMELRDKLMHFPVAGTVAAPAGGKLPLVDEALRALLSLGYARAAAEKAVQRAFAESGEAPVEELIKNALRYL